MLLALLRLLLLFVLAPHRRVPVILDGVVGTPRQVLGDLRPPIAQLLVQLIDELVLTLCPRCLLDVRVQVVMPPGRQRQTYVQSIPC